MIPCDSRAQIFSKPFTYCTLMGQRSGMISLIQKHGSKTLNNYSIYRDCCKFLLDRLVVNGKTSSKRTLSYQGVPCLSEQPA